MTITFIEPEETYELRHKILRPHQTLDDCKYPADHDANTLHLGVFLDGVLVSVASFFKESHPEFSDDQQYRLRGMATMVSHRGQQAGSSLIRFAENYFSKQNISLWWCNARTTVQGYYEKLGLEVIGDPYDIEPIGPHVLMVKTLKTHE
jgi:predicted GNAT family N-acyltransferase